MIHALPALGFISEHLQSSCGQISIQPSEFILCLQLINQCLIVSEGLARRIPPPRSLASARRSLFSFTFLNRKFFSVVGRCCLEFPGHYVIELFASQWPHCPCLNLTDCRGCWRGLTGRFREAQGTLGGLLLLDDEIDQSAEQLLDGVLRRGLALLWLDLPEGLLPGHGARCDTLGGWGTGDQAVCVLDQGVSGRGTRALGTCRGRGTLGRGGRGASRALEATHLWNTGSSVSLMP